MTARQAPGIAPDALAPETAEAAVAAVWQRHRDAILAQVQVLERAAVALTRGTLDDDSRRAGEREAHKLAGSLGTFGLASASDRARRLERLLAGASAIGPEQVPIVSELVVGLRSAVEAGAGASAPLRVALPDAGAPLVLIVEDDAPLADRLAGEARRRGLRVELASSPAAARALVRREAPEVVLLDLVFDGDARDAYSLIGELSSGVPATEVLVFTVRDDFVDRVEVARRGGSGFVQKSLPPERAIDQVVQLIDRRRAAATTLLAVDDDPALLDALRAQLRPERISVETLSDPLRFWDELERVRPDVVLLDFDMPGIDGIDLCRVLRNDPRWSSLPILFLSARRDSETVQAAFEAGADDYLAKPAAPVDLSARVKSRVERFQAQRDLAERDALSGVANRRAATDALVRLIKLSRRYEQPLTVVELDIDRFKALNDLHGHAAGDSVLRRLGDSLLRAFRGEDVVGRFGGEEFVLGLYGMGREDALRRMREFLGAFEQEEFRAPGGEPFHAAFSAGVAECPTDGADLQSLYRAADEALYRAKAAGRGCVLAAGADSGPAADRVDVVLVEDDDALGELLVHTLETRGHATRWFRDGAAAAAALCGEAASVRARLALVDVDLPGLDGVALLRRMVRDSGLQRTRVIMVTARAREDEQLATLELGAFDHVAKPFSLPVLMHKVERALAP